MTTKKTFILGLGAQKAGTTWLYEYIQNSPNANLGQLKEYHFLNMVCNRMNSKKKIQLLEKSQHEFSSDDLLRWLMLTKKSFYEIYFNSIINSGYQITGDITPQYAHLAESTYEYIKKRLETCGFDVKVIYIIRDPVERIWSNIRMEKNLYYSISQNMSDTEAVKKHFNQDKWRFDSKYDSTINRFINIFKKENIYIGVYEEMFNKDKVKKLSDFIGIDYNPSMIEKKVNASEKEEDLNPEVRKEVKRFYHETYEFCFKNFPQTKHLWNK